jgi:hypothetical protein
VCTTRRRERVLPRMEIRRTSWVGSAPLSPYTIPHRRALCRQPTPFNSVTPPLDESSTTPELDPLPPPYTAARPSSPVAVAALGSAWSAASPRRAQHRAAAPSMLLLLPSSPERLPPATPCCRRLRRLRGFRLLTGAVPGAMTAATSSSAVPILASASRAGRAHSPDPPSADAAEQKMVGSADAGSSARSRFQGNAREEELGDTEWRSSVR